MNQPPKVTAKKDGTMWEVFVHNPMDSFYARVNDRSLEEIKKLIPDLIILES